MQDLQGNSEDPAAFPVLVAVEDYILLSNNAT